MSKKRNLLIGFAVVCIFMLITANLVVSGTITKPGYQVLGMGDFNDDGSADYLVRNATGLSGAASTSNSNHWIWYTNSSDLTDIVDQKPLLIRYNATEGNADSDTRDEQDWLGFSVPSSNPWQFVQIKDVNPSENTGNVSSWDMTNASAYLDGEFTVTDILWENTNTGTFGYWMMGGTNGSQIYEFKTIHN